VSAIPALEKLAEVVRDGAALRQRAGLAPLSIVVRAGEAAATVTIADPVTVTAGAAADAAFALIANSEAWAKFAAAVPPVGYQSLVGMVRLGHLRVEGDMLAFGRNLLFLEQVFAGLRPAAPPEPAAAVGRPVIEPIVGRYLRLDFNGRPHRLYFEEAGRASRWSACTPPARTAASIARC
jgi:hypothetical protein